MRREPIALRVCLGIVHLVSALVPRPSRADWRAEWDAEVRHRWQMLDGRRGLNWRAKANLGRPSWWRGARTPARRRCG